MKVYNKDKTEILEKYDLTKGYLKDDTLIRHYDEIPYVEEQGHYETIREYANGGKDVEWVVDVKGQKYQPARDEEENIYVYIPYTENELNEIKKDRLRAKRKPLLQAFDTYKTNVFYGVVQETAYDKLKIIAWYEGIKALDEEAINNPPDAIKYYL